MSMIQKAPGPNNIAGHALRALAHELAAVFTDIFSLALQLLSVVLMCFKETTIISVLKKPNVSCLSKYQQVALTLIVL